MRPPRFKFRSLSQRDSGKRNSKRRRGAAVVLFVIILVAFLATAAFTVDVAYMHWVNGQLRASTDAAAMAAVEVLGQTGDLGAARAAAKHVALANEVSGQGITLTDEDIVFGRGRVETNGTVSFAAGQTPFNAARITGRKEQGSPSGSSPLFFAGIFGQSQWDTRQIAAASRWERDIALVVDRSYSMAFDNKLVDLQEAVSIFLTVLEDDGYEDRVALVSYNHIPQLNQNLTSDPNSIRQAMSYLYADGQTNIGGGIATGSAALMGMHGRPYVDRTMILMTDGIHNTGYDPRFAAQQAASFGIAIHTITFGPDADQVLMQQVADMTGGTTYHAPDGDALKEIFRRIALSFGTVLIE